MIRFEEQKDGRQILLVSVKGENGGFAGEMLTKNRIHNILPFTYQLINHEYEYRYSLDKVVRITQLSEWKPDEIWKILFELSETWKNFENLFIEKECLLLDPEYVFAEYSTGKILYCFQKRRTDAYHQEICRYINFLLSKMDHEDVEKNVRLYRAFYHFQDTGSFQYFQDEYILYGKLSASFNDNRKKLAAEEQMHYELTKTSEREENRKLKRTENGRNFPQLPFFSKKKE